MMAAAAGCLTLVVLFFLTIAFVVPVGDLLSWVLAGYLFFSLLPGVPVSFILLPGGLGVICLIFASCARSYPLCGALPFPSYLIPGLRFAFCFFLCLCVSSFSSVVS
jgi:hypothetical protein